MSPAQSTHSSTELSIEEKLEKHADRLVKDFELPLKDQLNQHTVDQVKDIAWKHLDGVLKKLFEGKKASNRDEVLTSTKKQLFASIDRLAAQKKAK